MKLVDLLVKQLEEWPEDVTYFVQDSDGAVKAGSGSEPREPSSDGIWIRRIHLDYYFYLDLCTDWRTSIVTKDIYTKHKEETQMKQEKMHTIELTEQELARVLFVMSTVNGEVFGKSIMSYAYDKLKAKDIGLGNVYSAIEELTKTANLPKLIVYYAIQKEWETFLGIGCKNKDILDKITNMERELTELKGML